MQDITDDDAMAKRWAVHVHQHVVPIGDLAEHQLDSGCWCAPREEEARGAIIFVHHALDQREDVEVS